MHKIWGSFTMQERVSVIQSPNAQLLELFYFPKEISNVRRAPMINL